ncbi:MAG: hypothetical protein ACOYZ7_03710 [Chloroflexota bacterium]
MRNKVAICLSIAVLSLALYGLAGVVYWRGSGPGAPLQEPMHYVDQYKYPRAWTRAQLAPGAPEPAPFAAVYGPNVVGQRFRSCCANLALLRLWLGGAAGQQVVLSLRTGPDRADTLASATIRLERDGYHTFTLPPLTDSAGQVYFFFVEAPEAGADQAVALRVIPGDRAGGVPRLNEYTAAGNLDFATYHRGKPGGARPEPVEGWLLDALAEQILPQTFAARLQQYKPGFLKGSAFGWLLAAMAAGAAAWLIVARPGQPAPAGPGSSAGRWIVRLAAALALGVLVLAATGVILWPRRATALSAGPGNPELVRSSDVGSPALVYDLLLGLYPAEKLPERRLFATAWAGVDGRPQPCVAAPPDSTLRYSLRLPPESTLRLGMALETAGARRRFEVGLAGGPSLFSRELHGPDAASATIDLSPFGGQEVRLELRTVGEENETSPGLWCAPQIESARSWLLPYPLTAQLELPQATFGGSLALLGYHLETPESAPGGQMALTLYWHAQQRVATDYTVFVHLLDETGAIGGQGDSQPVGGAYPTTLWSPETVVVDRRLVLVDGHAPAGQYRLAVGLYDLATLQRLPAFDNIGQPLQDDRLLLDMPLRVGQP